MGARYFLSVHCPQCDKVNEDVYFAPTSGLNTHLCTGCDKVFWIGDDFRAHRGAVEIDMRRHSTWGDEFENKTGSPAIQTLNEKDVGRWKD